jgi:Arc/MetJ-type ribon-helix-helix transcriptional regulator
MTTLHVSLSEENRSFVEEQASVEGFPSPDAYLQALVRQARLKKAKIAFDEKIRQTLKEPATEMTRADWDELEREVWENHRRDQERAGL